MIKEVFRKTQKPLSEVVLQTIGELGKQYSRLEYAYTKLDSRNKALFDACSFYLSKGLKGKATIYANEIAEIRKIMSTLQSTQLSMEKALLRLETFKAVSPTFEDLKGVFSDVKGTLGLLANVMPSVAPELDTLNSAINEVLEVTQFNMSPPEPLIINDENTEAILEEAANFLGKELQKRIPEPPVETKIPEPQEPEKLVKPAKPLIALAADGSEVYLSENDSATKRDISLATPHEFESLSEELVMDYIERNNGEMNVTKCAKELNIRSAEVFETLESLSKKGKIKIKQ